MSRILAVTFVAVMFLLSANTFARDKGRGCGTGCPPVCCGTFVSDGYICGGIDWPTVGCGTVVSNGCGSCGGGVYQNEGDTSIGVNAGTGGNVVGAVDTGSGTITGNRDVENNERSVTGGGRLDPDVLTGQTDGPLSQQRNNIERIWIDSSGKHQRLARFVRIEGTQVILQNAQGRTTRVEIQSLSTADQLFVDQLRQTSNKAVIPINQPRIATRS